VTLTADIFWSFRSPYSYLATRRYVALTEQYDLTINLRPVYPLAIRDPDFFERSHPNWLRYTFTDIFRVAQFHGIPFGPPHPDPIVQDIRTRQIADEQPYIFRLTRLGQVAARRGNSLAFCDEVSRLIWGGAENWHVGDHLAGAAERAGLDLAELDAEAIFDADALDAEIAPIRPRWKLRAIGVCLPSCLMANRFLAKTESKWRYGGCSKRGWSCVNPRRQSAITGVCPGGCFAGFRNRTNGLIAMTMNMISLKSSK
jgi:2-hydroxychromene-2-carboxylate isomerase